jgi:hypothetical protein
LMRQVFGFLESSADEDLTFTLAPNLPDEFLTPGQVFQIANLPYRGAQVSVGYRVDAPATAAESARLTLLLAADVPTECTVTPIRSDGPLAGETRPLAARHTVPGHNGERYLVMLKPAAPAQVRS